MAEVPTWDIATGAGRTPNLLQFDQATNTWGTVTVRARLTVQTNPVTKERAIAEIGNVQVSPPSPTSKLQVVSSAVAGDRMSVEVVVGVEAGASPPAGQRAFSIRLWPTASPFDAGAALATAAGGGFGAMGIQAGTRVPSADVPFTITVEEPSRLAVQPEGSILLHSDTREQVAFSAKMEVRSAEGEWTPRTDHSIGTKITPEDGTHCWVLKIVPRADRAWGGVAGSLQAKRFVVGDGGPLEAGSLRVFGMSTALNRTPPEQQRPVSLTTHPVTCTIAVVRTTTGRALVTKDAVALSADRVEVALSCTDEHLNWEGLELQLNVPNPPPGYDYSHLARATVPVNTAGRYTIDLRKSAFQDQWGRSCAVSLDVAGSAPAAWHLTVTKPYWTTPEAIDLRKMVPFDTLQELNERGGKLRVHAQGTFEPAEPPLIAPKPVKFFSGTLQVREGEANASCEREAGSGTGAGDCLVFTVLPAGAGGTGNAGTGGSGTTGTTTPGGSPVDCTVDLKVDSTLEEDLRRTETVAVGVHESLRDPSRKYLEYCLTHLAEKEGEALQKDATFTMRVRRVPIFLEHSATIARNSHRAVDLRSAIMQRVTKNMADFLIEIVMLGFSFAPDIWTKLRAGGKAAVEEAAKEAAEVGFKKELTSLGSELTQEATRLGKEAEKLAEQVAREGRALSKVTTQAADDCAALRKAATEYPETVRQLKEAESALGKATSAATKSEANLTLLTQTRDRMFWKKRRIQEEIDIASAGIARLEKELNSETAETFYEACCKEGSMREALEFAENAEKKIAAIQTTRAQMQEEFEAFAKQYSERRKFVSKVKEQIADHAKKIAESSSHAPALRAARNELKAFADQFANEPEIHGILLQSIQSATSVIDKVTWNVSLDAIQEYVIETPRKIRASQYLDRCREERREYDLRMMLSKPADTNPVSPDVAKMLYATDFSDPSYTPTVPLSSDTVRLSPGQDDWLSISYWFPTCSYYASAVAQSCSDAYTKLSNYLTSIALEGCSSYLNDATFASGTGYLEHVFTLSRDQLTFSGAIAARIKERLEKAGPQGATAGPSPHDAYLEEWKKGNDDDTIRHKEALTAFCLKLCNNALEPARFADVLIPDADISGPAKSLTDVMAQFDHWIADYEGATKVGDDKSYVNQLTGLAGRLWSEKLSWSDLDRTIDWLAFFVSNGLRLVALVGLFTPLIGPVASLTSMKVADCVDLITSGLRVVITGVGGLRDANAFVQDYMVIHGCLHAIYLGPPSAGAAGTQVMGTSNIAPRK